MRLARLISALILMFGPASATFSQDNSFALNSLCDTPQGDYEFGVYIKIYSTAIQYSSEATIAQQDGLIEVYELSDQGQEGVSTVFALYEVTKGDYTSFLLEDALGGLVTSVTPTGNSPLGVAVGHFVDYSIGAGLAYASGGGGAQGMANASVFAIEEGIGALRAGFTTIGLNRLTESLNTYNIVQNISFPYYKSCGSIPYVVDALDLPVPYPQVESVFFPWAVVELAKREGRANESEANALLMEMYNEIPDVASSLRSRLTTPSQPTPVVTSVSPPVLIGSPSPIQIEVRGTGFGPQSDLLLTEVGPGGETYDVDPLYINASTLRYGITVGTEGGEWEASVRNGSTVSNAIAFSVEAQADLDPPAAPLNFNVLPLGWSDETSVSAIWDNPSDRSGIDRVWYKIGSAPTSPTDGISLDAQRNMPLSLEMPGSGTTNVHVWLEDGEGNVSHLNRVSVPVRVDAIPPALAITSPGGGGPHSTSGATVDLAGTVSDTDSGVRVMAWVSASAGAAGFVDFAGGTWNADEIPLAGGENRILIVGFDNAGNAKADSIFVTSTAGQEGFTLDLSTVGSGDVIADPELAEYIAGTEVSLTAVPNNGHLFDRWTEDLSGSANPAVITMDGNRSVTARFEASGADASVTVIIQPAAAVAAGARWRYRDNGWMESGETYEINLPGPGSYANVEIYFEPISGWSNPGKISFLLPYGENRTVVSDPYVEIVPSEGGELVGTSASDGEHVGRQVAIGGDYAVIAGGRSYGADDISGHRTYLFERSPSGWVEKEELRSQYNSSGTVDDFGSSLALDVAAQPWLLVGASGSRPTGGVYSGDAHIFLRFGGSTGWAQVERLVPSDPEDDAYFGRRVALDHPVAVVSASFKDEGGNPSAGAVYIFKTFSSGNDWPEQQKLVAPPGVNSRNFGTNLAISGDWIAVSAYGAAEGGGLIFSGPVSLYRFTGSEWVYHSTLVSPTGSTSDGFGVSDTKSAIGLSGNRLVIGAGRASPDGMSQAGVVYVYDYDSATDGWELSQELSSGDRAPYDYFGTSVAIDGDAIVVGAEGRDNVENGSGAAYVFRFVGSQWVEYEQLLVESPWVNDDLGYNVDIAGDRALVGAPNRDTGQEDRGAAYVFDLQYNAPPSAVQVTYPPDGYGVTVKDGEPGSLPITWQGSTDPEGDELSYVWRLAATVSDLNAPLLTSGPTTGTSYVVDHTGLLGVLDQLGVGTGESTTVVHRVDASDGVSSVPGQAVSLVLSREDGVVSIVIDGRKGYRFLGVPAEGVTIDDLASQNLVRGVPGYYDGRPVTLWTRYNPNNDNWLPSVGTGEELQLGRGFRWLLFDRAFGAPQISRSVEFPFTLSTDMPPNTEDVTRTLNTGGNRFNYLANPFASALDLTGILDWPGGNNITVVVWVYDAEARGWVAAPSSVGPWEGFRVRARVPLANGSPRELTIPASAAGFSPSAAASRASAVEPTPFLSFTLEGVDTDGSRVADRSMRFLFSDEAQATFTSDEDDAKLQVPAEAYALIGARNSGALVGLDVRPFEVAEIPLALEARGVESTLTLSWDAASLPDRLPVTLVDLLTGAEIDLRTQSSYVFGVVPGDAHVEIPEGAYADASEAEDRFVLRIGSTLASAEVAEVELSPVAPNPSSGTARVSFAIPEPSPVRLSVVDVRGRVIAVLTDGVVSAGRHEALLPESLAAGVYVVRLETMDQVVTQLAVVLR